MPKRWLLIKQHEKKSSIKKWKMLYFRQMQESSLFSNNATFSMAKGSSKLCLCVSLWWKRWSLQSVCIGDHFQKCMTHCQHMFLPSHEESDNFALRRRKSFFKWFNYADSGAIIIRYISLQQQQKKKRNFFSQKWKFCWIYSSTKFLNCGSKRQYAITKLFKSVSGFVLS